MVTPELFRQLALSFTNASEAPHFEKTSFRVKNKIFATHSPKNNQAVVKLTPFDQDFYTEKHKALVTPLNNSWGLKGWTGINLEKIEEEELTLILSAAFKCVAK